VCIRSQRGGLKDVRPWPCSVQSQWILGARTAAGSQCLHVLLLRTTLCHTDRKVSACAECNPAQCTRRIWNQRSITCMHMYKSRARSHPRSCQQIWAPVSQRATCSASIAGAILWDIDASGVFPKWTSNLAAPSTHLQFRSLLAQATKAQRTKRHLIHTSRASDDLKDMYKTKIHNHGRAPYDRHYFWSRRGSRKHVSSLGIVLTHVSLDRFWSLSLLFLPPGTSGASRPTPNGCSSIATCGKIYVNASAAVAKRYERCACTCKPIIMTMRLS